MLPEQGNILAFDTSAAQCAAALLSGGKIVARQAEEMRKGQAERLFPMLEEILASAEMRWDQLDRIVVCTGPGNFTGIRIAVAAARGLAVSLGIPAVGVTTFEALAHGIAGRIRITLDGRRGQYMWQDFENGAAVDDPQVSAGDVLGTSVMYAGFVEGLNLPTERVHSTSATVDPASLAYAGAVMAKTDVRPAPTYLRPADAALPSDPPPRILA